MVADHYTGFSLSLTHISWQHVYCLPVNDHSFYIEVDLPKHRYNHQLDRHILPDQANIYNGHQRSSNLGIGHRRLDTQTTRPPPPPSPIRPTRRQHNRPKHRLAIQTHRPSTADHQLGSRVRPQLDHRPATCRLGRQDLRARSLVAEYTGKSPRYRG